MGETAEVATVAHGYSMADLERFAWAAIRRAERFGVKTLDPEDLYGAAWHAVVEHLYEAAEPPAYFDLINAAVSALQVELRQHRQTHGWSRRTGETHEPFAMYWDPRDRANDWTDAVAERLALPALLSILTPLEYEAVSTLAAHDGSQKDAANALCVPYTAFTQRVKAARQKVQAAWLAPDSPPAKASADACKYGHSRAEYTSVSPKGVRYCRLCSRNNKRRVAARTR